jgi:hypothetical protein
VARYAERLRPLAQDVDFAAMAVNAPALTAGDLVKDTGYVVARLNGRAWVAFVHPIAFA